MTAQTCRTTTQKTRRVTVEMIRRANAKLILLRKTGVEPTPMLDFLGEPIEARLDMTPDAVNEAWKRYHAK